MFAVSHDQGAFPKIVLLAKMENQAFELFLIFSVDTDRLTVPVNPNRHANTINRCGVVGSE